ncbi:MAG: helix-hairpin-helix domain-containing protein [Saprospiraceae bacterium]|nr:helix-hairpin-helix domain-containing protein [Saprospiraceae bacterium]
MKLKVTFTLQIYFSFIPNIHITLKSFLCYCVIYFIFISSIFSQDGAQTNNLISNIIEDFLESTDAENFDYNTIFESLNYYFEKPLNINQASEYDLKELYLLNEIQISDFIRYRNTFGSFLSIYELQVLPSWDLATIKNVFPFLKCETAAADYNLDFRDALRNGTSTLFIKSKRILEERKGFIPNNEGIKPYLGDPNHLYLRYRYEFGQLFKAGGDHGKDAGEQFFSGANKTGFDFYSFFAYAKDLNKTFNVVSLGDFAVSMGQGLILHNDFGTGKSSYVMNVKKSGRTIRPYSSVNEVNFFRGAGTVVNITKSIQAAAFISYKPADASVNRDTIENTDFDSFGSIRFDGFHRTETEINNKNSLHQTNTGLKVQYKTRDFKIAANGLYTAFDASLVRDNALYKKYLFSGKKLLNSSIDYSWRYRNLTFFGEGAISDNGGTAQLHGILMGLDRRMDVSVVYRNYDPNYQVLNANAFAESSQPVNEKGFYLGFELRPFNNITISSYADIWSHPWLGYRRDGPADGKEFLVKLAYTLKRKMDFYVQYRYEKKQYNSNNENIIDYPEYQSLQKLRLHLNYKITKEWEIRNRLEFSFFKKSSESNGILLYQDLYYKPIAKPFSFTARYSIFDINSFDARIYTYENDMLYEFYIPFFQNRGSRFYINFRTRIGRNYTWEFRIGRTNYDNVNNIGSGNELISGNTRTELKTQFKIRF